MHELGSHHGHPSERAGCALRRRKGVGAALQARQEQQDRAEVHEQVRGDVRAWWRRRTWTGTDERAKGACGVRRRLSEPRILRQGMHGNLRTASREQNQTIGRVEHDGETTSWHANGQRRCRTKTGALRWHARESRRLLFSEERAWEATPAPHKSTWSRTSNVSSKDSFHRVSRSFLFMGLPLPPCWRLALTSANFHTAHPSCGSTSTSSKAWQNVPDSSRYVTSMGTWRNLSSASGTLTDRFAPGEDTSTAMSSGTACSWTARSILALNSLEKVSMSSIVGEPYLLSSRSRRTSTKDCLGNTRKEYSWHCSNFGFRFGPRMSSTTERIVFPQSSSPTSTCPCSVCPKATSKSQSTSSDAPARALVGRLGSFAAFPG
mmetsp:Transcript_3037/g.18882  ORF Transcript_3037/g.18882 Transcript_3037/m.18882 type:complete len:377 (-) Transcript_3037:181-1311(-)